MSTLHFCSYGAAQEVTGSKHLIEYEDTRILLDCGMFQGRRKESKEKNMQFGFRPDLLDAVFLSHAHIDHCGLLPRLVKEGFTGDIYCTPATAELLEVMLRDSAHIQESDEKFFLRHPELYTDIDKTPLYTQEDVEACLPHIKTINIGETFSFQNLTITLYPAGHVIGSAMIHITYGDKTIMFTGDLGRDHMPLLIDRKTGISANTVVMESTYGGRKHTPVTLSSKNLTEIIKKTIARGGKVIIPSFALERTQEVLYYLEEAFKKGILPKIPIYVDSPMAINVTRIFQKHNECYDDEMAQRYKDSIPFQSENIVYTNSVEESKKINEEHVPCIIIAGSGMCEAGRIRHHLKNNVGDYKNTVVIVGYMAEHTLGRKLIEGNKIVSIFGERYRVSTEVVKLNSFSGHADEPDLVSWVNSVENLEKVILVHGEEKAQKALKEKISTISPDIEIAEFGKIIKIN